YLDNVHEKELVRNQQTNDSETSDLEDGDSEDGDSKEDDDFDKENTSLTIMLKNLYIAATKSRPKSSNYKNDKKDKRSVNNDRKKKYGPN
ncbi:17492_t:CDS:1, partial [Racocetra persica]